LTRPSRFPPCRRRARRCAGSDRGRGGVGEQFNGSHTSPGRSAVRQGTVIETSAVPARAAITADAAPGRWRDHDDAASGPAGVIGQLPRSAAGRGRTATGRSARPGTKRARDVQARRAGVEQVTGCGLPSGSAATKPGVGVVSPGFIQRQGVLPGREARRGRRVESELHRGRRRGDCEHAWLFGVG